MDFEKHPGYQQSHYISCSPPELNQKQEHESQNILGVDCRSRVPSRPVALSHEKSTVEDKRTPVLQKVQRCFTYFTLQSIECHPTVIGNSSYPVCFPAQLPQQMWRTLEDAGNILSMTLSFGYDRTVFPTPKRLERKYTNSKLKRRHTLVRRYL